MNVLITIIELKFLEITETPKDLELFIITFEITPQMENPDLNLILIKFMEQTLICGGQALYTNI
jgi:hypothetical protein